MIILHSAIVSPDATWDAYKAVTVLVASSEILLLLRKTNFEFLYDSHAFPISVYSGKAAFSHSSYVWLQNKLHL